MKRKIVLIFFVNLLITELSFSQIEKKDSIIDKSVRIPILYDGPGLVDTCAPDGRLLVSPGVQNIQVNRANRKPNSFARPYYLDYQGDHPGFTYQHHVDIGFWKGLLYTVWDKSPKDENGMPFPLVYSTSADGFTWSEPKQLFPPGMGWNLRAYFFHSSNDRMLVFAEGPIDEIKESTAIKEVLLVRELTADHRLGEMYTLIGPGPKYPPFYEECDDVGFVKACREAYNNKPFLEQQDLGSFLGERRMKWHDEESYPDGKVPDVFNWQFGKSFCFYHHTDGTLVGLCKMGFVTGSTDEGETWSKPIVPKGIVGGAGKLWAERTQDDRYALLYNPQFAPADTRFPLAIITSDDGITFRDMRVVHGEVPTRRYMGLGKDMGPQYVRGISEWADDTPSIDNSAMWVVYSMNKEDIWVSRIPVPIIAETIEPVNDSFDEMSPGLRIPNWNTYSPTWAPVTISKEQTSENKYLKLEDREPADYARAIRTFPQSQSGDISFRVSAAQVDRGCLEIELIGERGARPVRLALNENGKIQELRPQNIDSAPGLAGTLFNNPGFKNPDREVCFLFNMDQYWADHLGRSWSARWTGFIESPYSGDIIFSGESESGLRLKIGDHVVIDGIRKGNFGWGKIRMEKGKKVPVVLEVVTLRKEGKLRLFWEWPGQVHTIIPTSALSHDPTTLPKDAAGSIYDLGSKRMDIEPYFSDTWVDVNINLDCVSGKYTLALNDKIVLKDVSFAEPSSMVYALSFRTGEYRGAVYKPIEDLPDTENPLQPVIYRIDDVKTSNIK